MTTDLTIQPARFQCRHIFTDGRRCGSPALRREEFCYYHHTSRRPAPRCPQDNTPRGRRNSAFALHIPEDRSAIQHSIGQILNKLAANEIDPRRAGLLLYGLQIASLNLPRENPKKTPEETVDEITLDPTHGPLAPPAEFDDPIEAKSSLCRLLEKFDREEREREEREADEREREGREAEERRRAEATLPTIQAVAAPLAAPPSSPRTPMPRPAPFLVSPPHRPSPETQQRAGVARR